MDKNRKIQSVFSTLVILVFILFSILKPSIFNMYLFVYLLLTSELVFGNPSRKERIGLVIAIPLVMIMVKLFY